MEYTAAKLNEHNVVDQVIVGTPEWAIERLGGTWINSTGMQVGIGFTYHGDHFRPPQPFPSWMWIDETWNAPIPYPTDNQLYDWDETILHWVVLENN